MHRIGGKVEVAWPGYRAQFDPGLAKQIHIPQPLKHASGRRMDEIGELDRSLCTVVEPHAQTKAGQHF